MPSWSVLGYAAAHTGRENVFDSVLNSARSNRRYPSDQSRKRCRLFNALLEVHPISKTPFETADLRGFKPTAHKHS